MMTGMTKMQPSSVECLVIGKFISINYCVQLVLCEVIRYLLHEVLLLMGAFAFISSLMFILVRLC